MAQIGFRKMLPRAQTNRMNRVRSLFLYFQSSWDSVEPHKEVRLSVHSVLVRYAKRSAPVGCFSSHVDSSAIGGMPNRSSFHVFFLCFPSNGFFPFPFFLSSYFAFQCLQVDRCLTSVVFDVCVKCLPFCFPLSNR